MTDEPMSAAAPGDLASRGTAQSLALGFEGMEGACAMRAPLPGGELMQRFGTMATLDFRIDFIRPAKAGRGVIGEAECYSIAGGVAFVRGVAYEDDRDDPIAAAQAAFMLT